MKTLIFSLLFSFASVGAHAEVMPQQMHEILFGNNLIVHVKITNHTDHNYTIRIEEIFRDHQIGIKLGDYIKIKKKFNIQTSSERVSSAMIASRASGVAFLVKTENGWYMRNFMIDNDEKMCRLYFSGCEIKGSVAQMKTQFEEYFKEFELVKNGEIRGKRKAKELKKADLKELALLQYTRMYVVGYDKSIYEKLPCFEKADR
ncbi:MAG: hypothetical protein P8P74_16520 [Crocinitomicaceae bacterium]|nr:hypothetical protein [Crocinitomicaceae bacterium]